MNENKIKVIIVAGGIGKRMGKNIAKQFLPLHDKPIIIHTLLRFLQIVTPENIIVCVKDNHITKLQQLLQEFQIPNVHITPGGEHRTDSVRNGLQYLYNFCSEFSGYVLIHDAVRPFVKKDFLEKFVSQLLQVHALITTCPVKNSLRKITENGTIAVNREEYLEVQTPQGFLFKEIYEAYSHTKQIFFDDASLYENYFKKPVHSIEYIPENIKITTVVDLVLAEYLVKNGF